jgi:hypothetical protein
VAFLRILLIVFALTLIPNLGNSQIVSYGAGESEENTDTIKIARAAPEFKVKGYANLEAYIEEKLFQDPRTNMRLDAVGATALVSFTIDKYGFPKRAEANCSEMRLTLPLQNILDHMPRWKPGIKNDKNVSTKMEFYYSITRVEMGQYVVKQERMPPKLDKTTRNIKIVIISVCIAGMIAAFALF